MFQYFSKVYRFLLSIFQPVLAYVAGGLPVHSTLWHFLFFVLSSRCKCGCSTTKLWSIRRHRSAHRF
uniref:Uncharacterized protein n=1 Tax=Angiostrongylus cantonensis TaxID=6313 RepID=C7BVV1_ANGCA|nr:hypothetical protein [Angiostrongylus cantonensis]